MAKAKAEDLTAKNAADEFYVPEDEAYNPADDREAQPPAQTLDFDTLAGISTDEEQEEEDRASLYPPTGNWLKEEVWDFDLATGMSVRTDDQGKKDINPDGRTYFNLSGYCQPRVDTNGKEHRPKIFFRFSPDKRQHQEKPDEVDASYKRYLEACDLYLSINSQKAENPGRVAKVLKCLIEEVYEIRTMKGDSGLLVVGLQPKRVQRNTRR